MKKYILTIFFSLFIVCFSSAEKWGWVDFTFSQLTAGTPQKYCNTLNDGLKEWYVVRFDKNLSSEEKKYAILRFLNDMGCEVKDVTKDVNGAYEYSYYWYGAKPIIEGRFYVNGRFGYAVFVDSGFDVYKIERSTEQ